MRIKILFLLALLANSAFPSYVQVPVSGGGGGGNTYDANQYGVVTSGDSTVMYVIPPDSNASKVFKSGGASANPSWSLLTNSSLSGTAGITNANLATMATMTAKANVTGGTAVPTDVALASANTVSSIVYRDSSGNFSAGTVTAALTGTASGNTTYTANNHGLVVSGAANAMTVVAPDASASKVLKSGGASADPSWLAYDNANTVSTLVARDSSGNFAAGTITANLTGNASGSAATFTGNLTGDVTSTGMATSIAAGTVTGKLLTGYSSGAGTISSADTVLTAINKLNGNIALKGTGTVVGPNSSGNHNIVTYSGTSGGLIEDLGIPMTTGPSSLGIKTVLHSSIQSHNIIMGEGAGTGALGVSNTVVGNYSLATTGDAYQNSVFGGFALRFMNGNYGHWVAVGYNAGGGAAPAGDDNTCIGYQSCFTDNLNVSSAIAIGSGANPTASNQAIIGGVTSYTDQMYVGKGVTSATPLTTTIQGTGGSGSNINGAKLILAAGKGTGTGTSILSLATSTTGSTGTTLQTLADRLTIDGAGLVTVNAAFAAPNLATSSAATTGTLCWTSGTGNVNVDTTVACLASTRKVKQDIEPLNAGLAEVMLLRPVSYQRKAEFNPQHNGREIGLIAEEVQQIDDRLVAADDKGEVFGVRYMQLTSLLVKAIQEQQAEIEELKAARSY